jgi:hypothetical protein
MEHEGLVVRMGELKVLQMELVLKFGPSAKRGLLPGIE